MPEHPAAIGGVKLDSPFVLGPMAGITDAPMRRICGELGASLTYTEMVSAKGLYYGDKKTERLLYSYEDEGPFAIQIFGHDPEVIAFAADRLKHYPNVILDINMGCPVPKVFKNGDGSALSKDPELAMRVMEATVKAAGKPVTAKIRLGVDDDHINVVEMAKALESGGASAVAVHARTREQFYSGKADWSWIRKVKDSVGIPVIGNGDVSSVDDAARMISETGCDYVMISRAALGNPWIFREARAAWDVLMNDDRDIYTTLEEKRDMSLRQLSDMVELKGEYAAVREMRKVVGWYIKGMPGSAAMRVRVNGIESAAEMSREITAFFDTARNKWYNPTC